MNYYEIWGLNKIIKIAAYPEYNARTPSSA